MELSFLKNIQEAAVAFIERYADYLPTPNREYYIKNIRESESASDILSSLIRLNKSANRKLYVIIDEYDNFANTIISTSGAEAYEKLTHGKGFFRSFFNVLKGGTSSRIAVGFPLEELVDSKNFKSLLFYFGLLTIKGPEKDKLRLQIPNETFKRLYYDYIVLKKSSGKI